MYALTRTLLAIGITTIVPTAVSANALSDAAGNYRIEASSDIRFSVQAIAGSGINGRFDMFSGKIDLHPGALSRSHVVFRLKPASVATGEPRVDAFLRSRAVFDAGMFPIITFRSIDVTAVDSDSAVIRGLLTARGKTHEETFRAMLLKRDGRTASFRVVGNVLRSPYGMDVGTPIYSNVVKFNMIVRARRG